MEVFMEVSPEHSPAAMTRPRIREDSGTNELGWWTIDRTGDGIADWRRRSSIAMRLLPRWIAWTDRLGLPSSDVVHVGFLL